jgi:lysophospholipid acyltransferase (LPLAT)-like uncharacterized protein
MSKKSIKKFLLLLASFVVTPLLRLYLKTLRISFSMSEETETALKDKGKGAIIMVWHDGLSILPIFRFLNKYKTSYVLISNSRDGDLPSYITERFHGFHALRVKASARHMAAKEAIDILEKNQGLFLTPDGPKGPKHKVKKGTLFLAQKTNTPLFAFGWKGSYVTTLSTWDSFRIPWPFSRIQATLIGPILPEEQAVASAMQQAELNSFRN